MSRSSLHVILTAVVATLTAAATSAPLAASPVHQGRVAVEADVRSRVAVDGRVQSSCLAERMRHYEVPGLAIAIIHNGRVAWSAGYGTRLAGAALPVTPDTPFRVASISKPVTGLLAVRLAERGALDLDRDVNDYLTSWTLPESELTAQEKVTPRRILAHTAGTSVAAFPYYHRPDPIPTARDMLDGTPVSRALPIRVVAKPGEAFRYSGGGFLILQQALEDTTGKPFAVLADDLVLKPLGMTRSTFALDPPPAYLASAAVGHRYGKPIAGGRTVTPNLAGEGLWTTANDLARYAIAVRDAYLGKLPSFLSRSAAVEMLTPIRFADGRVGVMGLGSGVLGAGAERRFTAAGNGLGFRARFVMHLESGDGVVILSNGDGAEMLNGEVADAVARAYGWPVAPASTVQRRSRRVDHAELARAAGTYAIPAGSGIDEKLVRVEATERGLRVQAGNEAWWTYLPDADGGFFNIDMNSRITFAPGTDGRPALVLHHLGETYPPALRRAAK